MIGGLLTQEAKPFDAGLTVAGQRTAAAILRRMATLSDTPPCTPLIIHGQAGTGKTHLLSALAVATGDRRRVYWDCAELRGLRNGVQRFALWAEAATADLILIDDLDGLADCWDVANELAAVIDHCTSRGARTVATCRGAVLGCQGLSPRLRERLGASVATLLRVADLGERCSLIRHFCGAIALGSEVIDWLAARVAKDLHRLRACSLQLAAVQTESRAQLDVARARVVLEEAGLLDAAQGAVKEGEILPPSRRMSGVFPQGDDVAGRKARFKQMLTEAETDDEKRLALEIALGERLRELRGDTANDELRIRFERALSLLRGGSLEEALRYIG